MGRRRKLDEGPLHTGATVLILSIVCMISTAPGAAVARPVPDGRAYEMVTPSSKNGGDTAALTSSPDGERLAFYSTASFAGLEVASSLNSYVAQRGPDGWTTRPMLSKEGAQAPNLASNGLYLPADFTEDLSQSIEFSRSGGAEPTMLNLFSMKIDGSSSWLTAPTVTGTPIGNKFYTGRSADGSHVIFESDQQFDPQTTVPGRQVWERVDGHVRLVSILPDGSLWPDGAGVGSGVNGGVTGGTTFSGTLPQPDAVSEDGRKIFFGLGGGGVTTRVFVRIDGTETRELTLSQRAGSVGQPASTSSFVGASADGNIGVFSSLDQLTDDATPNGGLYAFDLQTNVLRFLSPGATDPSGAQIDGVSLISRDGSRVYFVSQSTLVPGKGAAGGHNLYVSDEDGVSFIATLGNNDGQNWFGYFGGGDRVTTRATADGRHFVFQSGEQLTSFDNRGHVEIYLYDADRDTIACVSCGSPGHAANGDASIIANPVPYGGFVPSPQLGRPRTFTDDGSRIFFQTTDSLVPEDVNDVADVYEYWTATEALSLISSGTGGYASEIADNSPDGDDVFFSTRDSLVKRDTDGGAKDIYVARVGGGFADAPDVEPCAGDACQPIASPAPVHAAALTSAPSSGSAQQRRAPRLFVRPITATGRKNARKTGRLTVAVSVEAGGTIRAAGTASYGRHTVYKLKPASATTTSAGGKNLHLILPSAVRRQLRRHHRVRLAITVSHNKATRPVHVTWTLS